MSRTYATSGPVSSPREFIGRQSECESRMYSPKASGLLEIRVLSYITAAWSETQAHLPRCAADSRASRSSLSIQCDASECRLTLLKLTEDNDE
ncbi:hypothetical protein J6590_068072 [Homalodisca vitripennis]|nr:hypothetical protein J6590_068072 [Homalodisca vitripennis]